jgi:polysaccharide transporter, PST family
MTWVAGEQLLRMAVGLLVSVALARQLGPEPFGIYNVVLATVAMVGALIPLAADQVVQRELIGQPQRNSEVLGSAILLRTLGTLFAVVLSFGCVYWIAGPRTDRLQLAVLGTLPLLFQPLESVSIWFASRLEAKRVTLARLPGFLVVTLARFAALLMGLPLLTFLGLTVVEAGLAAIGLVIAYERTGQRFRSWRVNRHDVGALYRDSWPLLIGGLTAMLYMRLDVLMLAAIKNTAEVGIYGAATRLSEVWYFLPAALTASLQPVLFGLRRADPARYHARLLQTYVGLGWLAVAVAVVVSSIAAPLCSALFGPSYQAVGGVLAVHVWAAVPVFLGIASSCYLITENLGKISMYRTALGLLTNVILNFALIPDHGALGAAWATLISYTVSTFSLLVFPATRSHGLVLLGALSPRAALTLINSARSYVERRVLW